jgi:polyisoprenoid-binding protein YceI
MKPSFFILLFFLFVISTSVSAQKFFTKTGHISFFSKTAMENIEAHNKTATCVMDSQTGNIQFSVLLKAFHFEKALMEEHFNENYVESEKFPKSEFKGIITNNSEIQYNKDGKYPAKVKGKLTIHGMTQEVESTGFLIIQAGKIELLSDILIQLSDYDIKIPGAVKEKVSNTLKISVNCHLESLKQ